MMPREPLIAVPPRLAATVMLLRDEPAGIVVCLARRSDRSRFVPGAYVFPGGAVDAQDASPQIRERAYDDGEPSALRVAALREVFEEVGIAFVRTRDGAVVRLAPERIAAMRARLAGGAAFAALLTEYGLLLDCAALVPYSNLLTPATEPVRFDTHFFVARARADDVASPDDVELHDAVWLAPVEALARAASGTLRIIYPTRLHLERLARFDTVAALLAHAPTRTIRQISPTATGTTGALTIDDDW